MTVTSSDLAWSAGITDTTVQTPNFQMVDLVSKNYFDDFQFTAAAMAVPEPTAGLLLTVGMVGCVVRRKRV